MKIDIIKIKKSKLVLRILVILLIQSLLGTGFVRAEAVYKKPKN